MPKAPSFTFQELILERAADPQTCDRPMARLDRRVVSYAEYARIAAHWAHLIAAHTAPGAERPKVAVVMQNRLEYLFAYGGAAFSGATLFGINTGLGGNVLERVIERSGASLVVVDEEHRATVDEIRGRLEQVGARILPLSGTGSVQEQLERLGGELGSAFDEPPEVANVDMLTPWMVIYTSGTTGLPKGIINNHAKLRGIGLFVSQLLSLGPEDVGYISTPLFHSNAVFLNWLPAFVVGASVALREKFTASRFLDDVFGYGATYWNYVGQPVHYVLQAIERACGGDAERVRREVTEHPKNRMRVAVGTGASGAERVRFKQVMGLNHVYENYGSTEAEIATWCMPGDPPDSVGELLDGAVMIIDEHGRPCPLLEVDAAGNPKNYAAAVGEIVRRGVTGRFQGYHDMPEATASKVQEGLYRSGDLGAIREIAGRRYLYFVGRTDDWIRKDGENFSAESVVEMVKGAPGVDRAAAYGAPHPVSDEWVMVALRMKDGEAFDPRGFFDYCEGQVQHGRDRKWFPDLVRVVDEFPWTETNKIKVRELKQDAYRPDRADRVFLRRRGDTSFLPLTRERYQSLEREFAATGRSALLA